VADFSNREDVERWLSRQLRTVAIAIAARAALRAVPTLALEIGPRGGGARRAGYRTVLPIFRATAAPWMAARYPTRRGGIAWVASRGNAPASSSACAACFAASDSKRIISYASYAVDASVSDATVAWKALSPGTYVPFGSEYAFVSADAKAMDEGTSPEYLASSPLWLGGVPEWVNLSWTRLQSALLALDEDWSVWTEWYRARVEGRQANEGLEVARVMIADEIWARGPKVVNAEIRRLIGQHNREQQKPERKPRTKRADEQPRPQPLDNIPSPFAYSWTSDARIIVTSSLANWPVFPQATSEQDQRNRLEACRALANDLMKDVRSGANKFQARPDYFEALEKYATRLPQEPGSGNILLADAEARALRSLLPRNTRSFRPRSRRG
jgi:hypothetical protein